MGMIDRKKIIEGLEEAEILLTNALDRSGTMTLMGAFKCLNNVTDALALLKEREPILLENQHKPYGISTNANSPWISRCPRCSKKVEGKQTRFCKYCGQAVKWDE